VGSGLSVEVLAADDWNTLRDVRLRALEDSPAAYVSSSGAEASWSETDWRRCFVDARWVVARTGGRIIGLARSARVRGRPADERHLESVWVEPGHRRTGVMRALMRFLTDLEPGVREWLVWVLNDNAEAREVYRRLGFEPTGERQLLPSGRVEERLRLRTQREPK
jgi:GNAT superfamily N-acetyltransferase